MAGELTTFQKYRDYNEVIVTITSAKNKEYTVSNINTKGEPGANCGCHLQSISISSPSISSSNSDGISTTGSISVIDYRSAVLNFLISSFNNYVDGNTNKVSASEANSAELYPIVHIYINSFTGHYETHARLLDWSMQFTGVTPTITLSWSTLLPSDIKKQDFNSPVGKDAHSPKELLALVRSAYESDTSLPDFIIKLPDKTIVNDASILQFASGTEKVTIDKPSKTTNSLAIDSYLYLLSVATIDGKPLRGETTIDSSGKPQFIVTTKDTETPTSANIEECSKLVFTQNGKHPAYSFITVGKETKMVIPITSFSFDVNFNNLILHSSLRENVNATQSSDGSKLATGADSAAAESKATAADDKNDLTTIVFHCYNTMLFQCNNINAPIYLQVYNEFGELMNDLSGKAMVREVTYTLDKSVVEAEVHCTHVFNSLLIESTKSPGVPAPGSISEEGGALMSIDPSAGSQSSSQQSSTSTSNTKQADYKNYLCSEDSVRTSLEKDKTESLLSDGTFDALVKEFLDIYGNKEGSNRLLDYEYIHGLISSGCFGLLVLLISVCNYGIKNYPSTWKSDPVKLDSDFKSSKDFCASSIGKKPYDYLSGGLGIAHWDSGNLKDIYNTIGFDIEINKEHIKSLILTKGSLTFKEGTSSLSNEPRLFPQFSKDSKFREFDNGLKQDAQWCKWAHDLLYYRDSNGNPVYQVYLFKLWIKKFWLPTIKALKSKQHGCLQDAARIARAGNSATGLISSSAGKSVEEQYKLYYDDKPRYMRQKAFCRRCADIIGWECNHT